MKLMRGLLNALLALYGFGAAPHSRQRRRAIEIGHPRQTRLV